MGLILVTAAVLVSAAAALLGTREMRRQKAARLSGREALSDREFYDTFYRTSGLDETLVLRIRRELADALEVPPSLLLPSDRFDDELARTKAWWTLDDGLDVLKLAGLKAAGARPIDWGTVTTLDDLIRQACGSGPAT